MTLNKVGDCLSYGLANELISHTKNIPYLQSVVLYLFWNGYLNERIVEKMKDLLGKQHDGELKNVLDEFLGMLARELKKQIQFDDFPQLVESLNSFSIPDWIYDNCSTLFDYLPEIYLVDNNLYFIQCQGSKSYSFCRVSTNEIESVNEYADAGLCENDESGVLSYAYSHIMGYNKEMGVLYLNPLHMKEMYVEYHLDTSEEVVFHNRCLGVIGGNKVVIEENEHLAIKIGEEKVRYLKKMDDGEVYEIEEDDIYVTPRAGEPVMFKPYRISVGGDIIPGSYKEAKDFLWNLIKRPYHPLAGLLSHINSTNRDRCCIIEEQDVFTLNFVEDYFKAENDYEGNKYARICHFLSKILRKYLDEDRDVLNYFYVMLEASRRYDQHVMKNNLSEKVYWRLEELEASGELKNCIHDLERFREKLLEDVYWDEERLKEERRVYKDDSNIGYFEIKDYTLNKVSGLTGSGRCIGNLLLLETKTDMEGVVAFNWHQGIYIIQYPRLLTRGEIQEIVGEFNLLGTTYRVIVGR